MGVRFGIATLVLALACGSRPVRECSTTADCPVLETCYPPDCAYATASDCAVNEECRWCGTCLCPGIRDPKYVTESQCPAGCTYSAKVGFCEAIPGEGVCR